MTNALRSGRRAHARAVALACLLVAACGGHGGAEGEELGVELQWTPSPPRVGGVRLELALTDGAGAPVAGATVRVEGNMNHAGMVPEITDAKVVGPPEEGRYVAELELSMGGDWFFVVTAMTEDGRRLEHVVEVPGVAGS